MPRKNKEIVDQNMCVIVFCHLCLTVSILVIPAISFENDHVNNLNGKHIIISTLELSPYMYLHHDDNRTIDSAAGVIHEMIVWMSQKYNFTFVYVEPPDGYFGSLENGTFNGMIGMLARKKVDLVAAQMGTLYSRSLVVDFTTSFSTDRMSAIIPPPMEDNFTSAIIKPFKLEVWALIILSMLTGAIVFWIFTKLIDKYMPDNSPLPQFWEIFIYFFGIISCQAGRGVPLVGPLGHSIRLTAGVWCLSSIVFVYLYSGSLTSHIAVPKSNSLIKSLDDLPSVGNDLQLAILKSSYIESVILGATSGTYKILGDFLRTHPENLLTHSKVKTPAAFLQKALSGRYAMVEQISFLELALDIGFKRSGKCEQVMMKEVVSTNSFCSMAVQKRSNYLANFDQGILYLTAFGLQDYWEKRFIVKSKCSERDFKQRLKKRRLKSLNLSNLIGPFLLLVVGLVMSCMAFLWERAWYAIMRS